MKINVIKPIVIFVVVLVLFVFLARAIYIHNLPAVTVTSASGGTIRHQFRSAGNMRVTEHDDIIANEDGLITLHVSEGDRVYAGQLLYSIEVDIRNLEDRLISLEHNRNAQNLQISRINSDIIHRQNMGVRAPVRPQLNLFELELDIENISTRIQTAETERDRLQALYDIGAVPRANLDGVEREINTLNDQLNAAIERREIAISRYEEELIRDTENYEQARADNSRLLADLRYQLRSSQLGLESIEDEIYRIENQLHADGVYEHHAVISGEIMRIFDAARGGRRVMQNTAVMSIRPDAAALYAVFNVPSNIDFVEIGQSTTLQIRGRRNIEGIVDNIRFYPQHLEIYVSFEFPDLQVGERVETIFERASIHYARMLPNSAIREIWWRGDIEGHFVLTIERTRGLFGYIYSTGWQSVTILEEGPAYTAIAENFPADLEVITGSSQTIGNGSRVRIFPRVRTFL
ncbi:MAG: HlyD family efflux transporter periplasmic adaptor subunit [Defluviitaleaceae bacterium]|nr:HlyD family efflux transporter periplasmic adaptor subunit [Defluviitaleaceae bacterium]